MKKLVVFASGSGSNFQAIIDSVNRGDIQAQIAGLITTKPHAGAVQRANHHQIPVAVIPETPEGLYTKTIHKQLSAWQPDLIILAGFLKKIPDSVVRLYPDSIINIHPSLLPKFGGKGFFGLRVHQAVLQASEKETGCTVHYVNERYDDGTIIAQKKVPVLPGDTPETLAGRVLAQEHKLLPSVIANLINP